MVFISFISAYYIEVPILSEFPLCFSFAVSTQSVLFQSLGKIVEELQHSMSNCQTAASCFVVADNNKHTNPI